MPCKEAWELFRSRFHNGERVLIVTCPDSFYRGPLRIAEDGCWLEQSSRPLKERFFPWEGILFMTHDGFPVKRLMGEDGERLIEEIHPTDSQRAIWDALLMNPWP